MVIRKFLVACALTLVASLASRADDTKSLVGVWAPAKSEDTIEFTKNGKMKVKREIAGKPGVFEGTYKVEGEKLSTTVTFRGETNPAVERFVYTIKKLTEKELTVEDEKGKLATYTRPKK